VSFLGERVRELESWESEKRKRSWENKSKRKSSCLLSWASVLVRSEV
jgi:hypothetical protein